MTFKFGLSTWVATMERPVPGSHLGGMVKANNEDWFLNDDEKIRRDEENGDTW